MNRFLFQFVLFLLTVSKIFIILQDEYNSLIKISSYIFSGGSMKINSRFCICQALVFSFLSIVFIQSGSAQIASGEWYCIQVIYDGMPVEGFDAKFEMLGDKEYQASFQMGTETGSAHSQCRFEGDSLLFSELPSPVNLYGAGSMTSGGKLIYEYSLRCSQTTWDQGGQVSLGWGFPEDATESRILYETEGDSLLILKSVDEKTVLTYSYGVKRPLHNPVVFAVNMNVQQKLGNFNPSAGDRVVLRDLFFHWVDEDSCLSESALPGVYQKTIDFPGSQVGNTFVYKFAIQKHDSGAVVESDPARVFTVEPGGQSLGIPFFDRKVRTDEVEALAIADSAVIGEYEPATAYNTARDEFLVAWIQEPADIVGRIFKSDGSPVGPCFPVSVTDAVEIYPAVAYNSSRDEWLVVWQSQQFGNSDIYGVRLDYQGKKLFSPNSGADSSFTICSEGKNQNNPKISYNYMEDCYLVVWTDYRNLREVDSSTQGNTDIYGQRVDGNGALLTPGDPDDPSINYTIVKQSYYNEAHCDVAYCGWAGVLLNEWLVTFTHSDVYGYGGQRIWGVRVKGSNGLRLNTWGEEIPDAELKKGGYSGPPWLPEFPIGWDEQNLGGTLLFTQGSPHVESNDVADPVPAGMLKRSESRYSVPEFLIAWTDMRTDQNVYCQRVAFFPDSTAYRLGMKPTRGPDSLFTAVLLDKDGNWADSAAAWITWPNVQVTTDPYIQSWNDLSYSSNDGAYMIVWNDWRNTAWNGDYESGVPFSDIYGQRLWINPDDSVMVFVDHEGEWDVDPAFNTPIAFSQAAEGNSVYPAIAHGAQTNTFLIAYEFAEETMGDIDIFANLYSAASPYIPNRIDKSHNNRLPEQFVLHQNYPNPFNPTTTIAFELPAAAVVKVEVFNTLGRRVARLLNEHKPAGSYRMEWRGADDNGLPVASGIYFYKVTAGNMIAVRKMALMR